MKAVLRRSMLFAAAAAMLASCVVEEVPMRPGPPRPVPPSGPAMCTREYMPVCARRGNEIRTFSNACMARVDGYRVVDHGPCRGGPPPMQPRPPRPGGPQPGPAMCPMIYAPVCAGRAGVARTFGNECQARAEGFRVLRDGPC